MKKNLLFTTAIVAASFCFADAAKALDNEVVENTTITEGISGTSEALHESAGTLYSNKGGADPDTAHHYSIKVNSGLEFKYNGNTLEDSAGSVLKNFHGNTLEIGDGVVFEGNEADYGGAVWSEGASRMEGHLWQNEKVASTLKIGNKVKFIKNEARTAYAGALAIVGNHNSATIGNDVLFQENKSDNNADAYKFGGGALYIQSYASGTTADTDGTLAVTIGSGAKFIKNEAVQGDGGAILVAVRDNDEGVGGDAAREAGYRASVKTTIGANALFDQNKATDGKGGAIANRYRNGPADEEHNATMIFANGASFTNNTASSGGGAIYNTGSMEFGNVTFKGNKFVETPNDIENTGTITFKGNTTLDGGITGATGTVIFERGATLNATMVPEEYETRLEGNVVFMHNNTVNNLFVTTADSDISFGGDVTLDLGTFGDGTLYFSDNTTLTATLDTTFIGADTVHFAYDLEHGEVNDQGKTTLNLIVPNGTAEGEHEFIHAETLLDGEVEIIQNPLFTLELEDDGMITVTKKGTQEIVNSITEVVKASSAPVKAEEVKTLAAVVSTNGNGTDVANAITDRIFVALQSGNAAAAVQAAQDLAPTTSQQVMGVAQGVNNMLSNVTGGRMAAVSGRAGGDAFIGGALWAQALYNHTKQSTTSEGAGFEADSNGVAMGIDGKANDALTIGFGYGYTATEADSTGRKVDVDGHNFFIYGSYTPSAWYIDTMVSYGVSKYEEKKAPMGVAMKADYHVNTFAANIMTGYGFKGGITPEGGLRYVSTSQETYNDGAQEISADGNDVLTAVLGVKYETEVRSSDWRIKPNLRLAATYDLISDNSQSNISIIGGGNYEITGKRLHRFGGEAGVGVTGSLGKWDLSLEYNGGFRKDYQSHTGLVKAQYNF